MATTNRQPRKKTTPAAAAASTDAAAEGTAPPASLERGDLVALDSAPEQALLVVGVDDRGWVRVAQIPGVSGYLPPDLLTRAD